MRVDVLTIFPEYLAPLELSLVGKARREGLVDVQVHDLRSWTTDRHRTVDDTPTGGGAGMVMRPDVWGEALDQVLAAPLPQGRPGLQLSEGSAAGAPAVAERVVMIPTPSGVPLTQREVERLTGAAQIVVACGRYEGIDARVAEYYRARAALDPSALEVREFSLGDYVLNGGEVAALVLIEGVGRLLPGVVGNPQSLVEESHGAAGLLEYPVFTKPPTWRDQAVPEVLLSGDHGRIHRWRRDRALQRTAERRPDMIAALDPTTLDSQDRRMLLSLGWFAGQDAAPQPFSIEEPTAADAPALARLAAATFPDACPPDMPAEDVAQFVAQNLSAECFAHHLADPHHHLLVARTADGALQGYTLTALPRGPQEDTVEEAVARLIPRSPVAYLSKFYLSSTARGTGLAAPLMDELTRRLTAVGVAPGLPGQALAGVWLGTNVHNKRARKFYRRHGWKDVGGREFVVGDTVNQDRVYFWQPPDA